TSREKCVRTIDGCWPTSRMRSSLSERRCSMFFIFWGQKNVATKIGFVADYCEVCRGISIFRLDRIAAASHVYGIAVDEGRYLGHSQTCISCKIVFNSTPTRFYGVSDSSDSSIDDLIRQTHPDIRNEFSDRLALEEQIAKDPHGLHPDLRKKLLMEVFQMAAT